MENINGNVSSGQIETAVTCVHGCQQVTRSCGHHVKNCNCGYLQKCVYGYYFKLSDTKFMTLQNNLSEDCQCSARYAEIGGLSVRRKTISSQKPQTSWLGSKPLSFITIQTWRSGAATALRTLIGYIKMNTVLMFWQRERDSHQRTSSSATS